MVASIAVHTLHVPNVFLDDLSELRVSLAVNILLTLLVAHVLMHHLQYLLASSVTSGLGGV